MKGGEWNPIVLRVESGSSKSARLKRGFVDADTPAA